MIGLVPGARLSTGVVSEGGREEVSEDGREGRRVGGREGGRERVGWVRGGLGTEGPTAAVPAARGLPVAVSTPFFPTASEYFFGLVSCVAGS